MQIIFLTYIDRSGSTFLISHLGRVEKCVICPEAEVLPLIFMHKPYAKPTITHKRFTNICRENRKLQFWQFTPDEISVAIDQDSNYKCFCKLLEMYAKRVNANANSVVFKAFEISLFLSDLLPEHKIIKLIRDPRDIFLSQKRNGLNNNPVAVAKYWNGYFNRNHKELFTVRYEDLVNSFQKEFDSIIKYLFANQVSLTDNTDYSFININHRYIHSGIDSLPDKHRAEQWRETEHTAAIKIIERMSISDKNTGYTIKTDTKKPYTILYIVHMAFYYLLFVIVNRFNIILWNLKRLSV